MSDFNIQLDNKAVEELSEAVGGGGSVETIELLGNTLLTATQYFDIVDKKLIAVTGEDKQVILSGWDEETSEYARLSSTIYDGKYTLVEIGENTDQSTSEEFPFKVQSIQEVSVGGGGSTLYQHNILVEEFVQAQVLTTSATPFTLETFIQWLGDNNYPCNGMAHSMSEDAIYGSSLYLFVDNNLLSTYLYDKPESGNVWNYNFNDNVDLVFDDTVIQIQ